MSETPATGTQPANDLIPWRHGDHRLHPEAAHYCRCRCDSHIDLDCSEHGWMYAGPDPEPRRLAELADATARAANVLGGAR